MANCEWTCKKCTDTLKPTLKKLGLDLKFLVMDDYPQSQWISFCQELKIVVPHRSKMLQDLGILCFPYSDYVLQRIYVNNILYDKGIPAFKAKEDKIGKIVSH